MLFGSSQGPKKYKIKKEESKTDKQPPPKK
jgi:hypothetical protein